MRGSDVRSGKLFSYIDLEQRVPSRHPLRAIRLIVNEALAPLASDPTKPDIRITTTESVPLMGILRGERMR